jgi:hypothetical protein
MQEQSDPILICPKRDAVEPHRTDCLTLKQLLKTPKLKVDKDDPNLQPLLTEMLLPADTKSSTLKDLPRLA